jgi:colanic acid/amylovoran biosynthesis glycosyltransferase
MSDSGELRVAVFSRGRDRVSETFIRAHIDRLPFTMLPRYGDGLTIEDASGRKVWFWGFWFRAFANRAFPQIHAYVRTFFLARHLRAIKADAVLAEYGTTGSYLAPACERAGVPLFVHFHGFDASVHEVLDRERETYQRMFAMAAGVVAVSNVMKERLLALGARPELLYVNRCGVDPDRFDSAKPADTEPHFFAVGRFVEKKAPYLTILAYSRVVQVVPEATLTIIGDGALFGPCKRMIQALHLEDSVTLLGVRGSDEVSRQMSQARAFVQHSLVAENGDSEGTPVSVIEAQMTGLPVVATRHAGIPEVVLDGETGFIVEEGDVDAMADAMIELAQDPALAGRLGAAARARAAAHFTMDQHIEQLAAMIREGVAWYRQQQTGKRRPGGSQANKDYQDSSASRSSCSGFAGGSETRR